MKRYQICGTKRVAALIVQIGHESGQFRRTGRPAAGAHRSAIHPNKTAVEQATKARLTAFNCSTAGVRLEMPGRTDLFAEQMINAQGFKDGLNGEYMVDSREYVFTQSGWSTAIECNAGKKSEKTLKIVQL